jgi:hypothetical protein
MVQLYKERVAPVTQDATLPFDKIENAEKVFFASFFNVLVKIPDIL